MTRRAFGSRALAIAPLALVAVAFGACGGGQRSLPNSTAAPTEPPPTETAVPPPTPIPVRDIRATRLAIPALGINTPVELSYVTAQAHTRPAGCPSMPSDSEDTFTVPTDGGVATPKDAVDGMDNRAWIFGHSRWLGTPGLFFKLADINVGDQVIIDGVDRKTGKSVENVRFVVDGLYLADLDTGDQLVVATSPDQVPAKTEVVLQTSAREDGYGKQWILNENEVLSKAKNVVDGDFNDPCKYLLLFVTAHITD